MRSFNWVVSLFLFLLPPPLFVFMFMFFFFFFFFIHSCFYYHVPFKLRCMLLYLQWGAERYLFGPSSTRLSTTGSIFRIPL
jgi:hypothetical protein